MALSHLGDADQGRVATPTTAYKVQASANYGSRAMTYKVVYCTLPS